MIFIYCDIWCKNILYTTNQNCGIICNINNIFANKRASISVLGFYEMYHWRTCLISQFNSSKISPIMPDEIREHLTRDQRPFLHPESLQILQIHSFSSSVHLTHLLQGSGQRTPDTRSETIPSSRISPDPSDSQLLLFSSPHSSSTGFRSENTWHEIRDHSFIQNHSRSFRFTASSLQFTHSSSTGFRSENTWHEIRDYSFI